MMKIGTDLEHAAKRLKQGQLVAMPTETVYGLAANACDDEAIKRIYATKGRPSHNPLIVHVPNIDMAKKLVEWNEYADMLADAYWPGPLTMVLKRKEDSGISKLVSGGLDTLAIRMPAHPIAEQLLRTCNLPLAAPSANLSGTVTSTSAAHVARDFTDKDIYILDAGQTQLGLESTVVQLTDVPTILRPGSITQGMLEGTLGQPLSIAGSDNHAPASPGMLSSHYAPKASLRLNATDVKEGEALLAFGPPIGAGDLMINLSEQGDLAEAASNLFTALRALDEKGALNIAVMPIANEGIGVAINDRLNRAAAPK